DHALFDMLVRNDPRGDLMRRQIDRSVLEMALAGYAAELQKIETAMSEIRRQLGDTRGKGLGLQISLSSTSPKRVLSVAARKRRPGRCGCLRLEIRGIADTNRATSSAVR